MSFNKLTAKYFQHFYIDIVQLHEAYNTKIIS